MRKACYEEDLWQPINASYLPRSSGTICVTTLLQTLLRKSNSYLRNVQHGSKTNTSAVKVSSVAHAYHVEPFSLAISQPRSPIAVLKPNPGVKYYEVRVGDAATNCKMMQALHYKVQ